MRPCWDVRNGSGGKIRPLFGLCEKLAIKGSKSPVAWTGATTASTARDDAEASMADTNSLDCGDVSGLKMTATRVRPGDACLSRSSHLPAIDGSNAENPVMLPPGCARFETNP